MVYQPRVALMLGHVEFEFNVIDQIIVEEFGHIMPPSEPTELTY